MITQRFWLISLAKEDAKPAEVYDEMFGDKLADELGLKD